MKKAILMFAGISVLISQTNAQEKSQPEEYKIPESYNFDYKVSYQINEDEKATPKILTYYFTKSGDYMGMQIPEEGKKDMGFMVNTKDGKMITFSNDDSHKSKAGEKVITIIDTRHIWQGLSGMAKNMQIKDSVKQKKEPHENGFSNFSKTGNTKNVFGYMAEEYSATITKDEKNGVKHAGIIKAWYAKVDFDPEMMFSFGLGNISSPQMNTKINQSHQNNIFGMGLTQKNYLLIEMDFDENGGKSGKAMKVTSIEKTSFNQSTTGYIVRNFAGMDIKDMLNKQIFDAGK